MNKKFIYFKTKTQFTAKLSSLPNNAIVFIEDTKQIWTHGVFFDTSWDYVTGKPDTYTPSAHTLGSHSDVTLAALADGNILRYNGSKWVNNTLAQAGIATPADITTAINNIEIGGRNLIPKSNFVGLGNSNGWNVDNNPLYNGGVALKLDNGRKALRYIATLNNCPVGSYTLSARYYISPEYNTGFRVATAFTQPNSIHNNLFGVKIGEWHTHSLVFKNTIEGSTISVSLYNTDTFTQGYIIVDWIKLEKGNKATDWSPSPKDQVSDWNETGVTSFSYIKNKPTTLADFTDNIGVATHIANKANPHAVTFAQLGAKPTTLGGYGITDGVQINSSNWANFRYTAITEVNKDVVENVSGSLKLDGWYNLNVGATSVHGTRLTIAGLIGHDKTQLYFNGVNGSIQYRKSWYPNTPWTSLRTIWDSGNLTNLNQLTTRNFSDLQNKPTTLGGYGITDAVTTDTTQTITGAKTFSSEVLGNNGFRVNNSGGAGVGISLYGSSATNPAYGLMFARTANKGTHGSVIGEWATYFTMSSIAGRGWIFTTSATGTTGNVASISNTGIITASGTITSTGFYQSSDIRLKNVIEPLKINIEDILNIPSFYFTYKDKDEKRINIGTSAQEVQKVFPEIVSTDSKGMLSVEYDKFGLIALELIKTQQKEIDSLKYELNNLKLKIDGYRN